MPRLDPDVMPCLPPRRLGSVGIAVLAGVLSLSGCGTTKLHSETRQQQGEAAAKAWREVDLKAYFDAERDNQAKLLAEEIESTGRLAAVNRETEIRVLAAKKVSDLSGQYDEALSEAVLDGSGAIDPATLGAIERGLLEARSSGTPNKRRVGTSSAPRPSCSPWGCRSSAATSLSRSIRRL